MRYLVGLPICLFVLSGVIWMFSGRSHNVQGGDRAIAELTDSDVVSRPGHVVPDKPGESNGSFDTATIHGCMLAPIQENFVAAQVDGLLTDVHVALGANVEKGHGLAHLDDQKLRLQIELLQIKASSTSSEAIAKALFDEAEAKVTYARKANESGLTSVPELELKTYLAQRDRFASEIKKAIEEREEAKKELDKAKVHLQMHQVKSAFRGEVVKIYKKAGETVKQGESVFRVARMDRLRVEGFCRAQNAGSLRVGQPVLVEPELHGSQIAQLVGHTAPVNQLAISQDGKFLASASDDGTVSVWTWPGAARVATLAHPGAVHAVDLKHHSTGYLLVSGGEDRIVRIWRLSPQGTPAGDPVLLQGHDGVIRSIAIAPDGARCVSGGEDRKIGVWDIAQKKNAGWVSAVGAFQHSAHHGAVTSIQFADQNTLVSAGTDNVHKVWNIKAGKSELIKVHKGRTGDVAHLTHSNAHQRLILDHGDELWLLDRTSGAVQGVLRNAKHVRFEGFASFSPSNRLIVTASVDGLQLWRTPADSATRAAQHREFRASPAKFPDIGGFEIRQYHLPKATQARCGVIAPDESVFFTGGTGRAIQAWAIPPVVDWELREAKLTYIGSEVEPGTDLVRIQAELDNPPDRSRWWRPGTFARLKVFP